MDEDDFPDEPVPTLFAAMLNSDSIVMSPNYDKGRVAVGVGDHTELVTASQARELADSYEETARDEGWWGSMQSEQVVERLHRMADEVEPYADDAAE